MKDNVAGKLRRYTNTTLHEHDVVLADRIGPVASENRDRRKNSYQLPGKEAVSYQFSVVRPCVASEPVSDVKHKNT